ncbi:MAG: toll/interleukin-1 receptor domain-containing protein [Nitrospira sp.]
MNHFDVFLSYHWRDHAQVEALARRLREQNLTVFLDRWYLTPGQSWPTALETTLASCGAVVVCIGPGEMGPWQQRERDLAIQRQVAAERQRQTFPVIPLLFPGAEPPLGFLSQNTWVDFRSRLDNPVLLATLVNAIYGKPPGPDVQETVRETLARICPYRGLLYFREEDAPFFFGREAAITQLVSAVQQHHLVAVVGASGSGKSSVVRAGLVPQLRRARDRVWEVATIVPTDRPIHALAAVLMLFLEPDMTETDRLIEINKLVEALLSQTIKLREVVDRVLAKQPGTDRLLLIVDQWEELFTLCADDRARRCFIDNMLEATTTTKLSAVLTLRGDFFGRAITDYRPLSDRVQGAQVNLSQMKREELRLAIEEPAKKVGLTFEAGLVDLILEQVGDEPGHLPLVEFVLRRLWEDRQGGQLHHAAYKAMGQLEGAIVTKAESIYANLSAQDQQRAQQIFLCLVRPGEGEADTRRRATSSELGIEMQSLVKALADERLVVISRLAGSEEDTIEVSHETLIRHWQRLLVWVGQDREFLLWQQRHRFMIEAWKRSGSREDALLRGDVLLEAEQWLHLKRNELGPSEIRIIEESSRFVRKTRLKRYVQLAAAIISPLFMYIGLADIGMNVPGEVSIQRSLDRYGLSIFRPVRSKREIMLVAANIRRKILSAVWNRWENGEWFTTLGTKTPLPIPWSSAQAVAAVMRLPASDLSVSQRSTLINVIDKLFDSGLMLESDGVKFGWRGEIGIVGKTGIIGKASLEPFSRAEPGLWIGVALAEHLHSDEGISPERRKQLRLYFSIVEQVAKMYRLDGTGAYNVFPHETTAELPSTYTTALALMMLLRCQSAELGNVDKINALVDASTTWLVTHYENDPLLPGWRSAPEPRSPISDGLTLFVFSQLLATAELRKVEISPAIIDGMRLMLNQLRTRKMDYPRTFTHRSREFRDHTGQLRVQEEQITHLWYPWSIEFVVRWLNHLERVGAGLDEVLDAQRVLGHLVVDLEDQAIETVMQDHLFVMAESLYGLGAIPAEW